MKIGVLTNNPQSYSSKRLIEVGAARHHQMQMIHLSFCYLNISAKTPEIHYRNNETFQGIEAIIPRISSQHTFYGTAVLRQFEMMGVYTPNSAISTTWSQDKLRAFQILARKKLPMPITGYADSPQESEKLIEMVGDAPLIVRLLEGTEGKGTVFAETHQAAISVINAFKQLKANILVQEYIQEGSGVDIRCIVVGNKVIAAVQRSTNESSIRSHKIYSKNLTPIKITKDEKKMAVKAAKALKLNLASVDLIRSNRGPLILDVNPSPSIEQIEKATNLDLATKIIQFIEEARGTL